MVNKKIDSKKTKVGKEMNQAEYAIYRGVSRPAVTKWKQRGLIVLTESGKIDVNQTDANIDELVNTRSSKPVNKSKPKAVNKNNASKRKRRSKEDIERDPREIDSTDDIKVDPEIFIGLRRILDNASLLTTPEALRVKENCLAHLRWLEAKIKSGELVDAESVNKQAFNFFRRERDALLNLPNRISAVISAELGIEQNRLTILLEREINAFLRERTEQPRLEFE